MNLFKITVNNKIFYVYHYSKGDAEAILWQKYFKDIDPDDFSKIVDTDEVMETKVISVSEQE